MIEQTRFLKLEEVCQLVGFSKSELYRRCKAGTFPQRFNIGPKATRWDEAEVRAWMAETRRAGAA